MRAQKSENDGRRVYHSNGECRLCVEDRKRRQRGAVKHFDWSKEVLCSACKCAMRKKDTPSNGLTAHAWGGVCVNCRSAEQRRRADTPTRLESITRLAENRKSLSSIQCPNGCRRLIRPAGLTRHLHHCQGDHLLDVFDSQSRGVQLPQPFVRGTDDADRTTKAPEGFSYIYAVTDSDLYIRYIGKTKSSIDKRLRQHMRAARGGSQTYCARWLRSIEDPPRIFVLGLVENAFWELLEKSWIAHFEDLGARLTNLTQGGSGNVRRKQVSVIG